jgi:DNA-binding transcriptional LysR family regulator
MKLEARLRAFAAFARQRSFSAAATELRVSQPAVSKHIAELEAAIGVKLVDRARRDGALTSAGEFVANYVLRAEALLVQADLGAAQFRESGTGSVTIVASSLTGTYVLPEIIADFTYAHPGIRVDLKVGTASEAVERLRSHRAELGFVAGTVAAPEIEAAPLLEYEVVLVGKPAILPRRPSREVLEQVTWLTREEGAATRISSDAGLARLGIVPMRSLELPTIESLLEAVRKGYGLAAISRNVVAADLRSGTLAVIEVRGWDVRNTVSVLRVRDATLTPAADRFQAYVRAQIGKSKRAKVRGG